MIDLETTREFLRRIPHRVALVGRSPRRSGSRQLECRWHTLNLIVDDVVDEADSLARDYRHCYINLNPIKAELHGMAPPDGTSIRDIYISRRLLILIDVDGHNTPLSEAERQKNAIKALKGEPLIETFSGHGYGLLYETDLLNDDHNTDRVKLLLQQLHEQFPCVDRSVCNPGRLTRLIGCPNDTIPTRILN